MGPQVCLFSYKCFPYAEFLHHCHAREFTGHNSPLISREEEMSAGEAHPGYLYNQFDTMKLYMDGGMDPSKLVLGLPLYGRGFELVDPVSVVFV